jgi:DNA adenine methylase
MKYMGSKLRIARDILPIILQGRKPGQYYVEPFCGGCNLLDKVTGNRIAGDINKYLIAVWQGIQENKSRPYKISKSMYDKAREECRANSNDVFSDFEIGWIGWMASYRGRFFSGYSGHALDRNYIAEQIKNTEKQIDQLQNVQFFSCDYSDLLIPAGSIIYCDIPYQGTEQYSGLGKFDYNRFWQWCISQKIQGHTVFVSEYNAPEGIECVWSKEVTNSLNTTITYKRIEKLFRI